MVVRRVGVWSVARIYGAMTASFGLIAGLCLALLSTVSAGLLSQSNDMPSWLGPMFGVGAIVFLPIFYGVIGLVVGAISGALYNLFAGMVGGVELDIQ
jgi:hypothetical protein